MFARIRDIRFLCVALIALACAGCTSVGRIDATAAAPSGNQTYFVFGVTPDNVRISIYPGDIENNRFAMNNWLPAAFYGAAEHGYIVGGAHEGETLAITVLQVVASQTSIGGSPYAPCGDSRTIVFKVPAGKVVYITDVNYRWMGDGLVPSFGTNLEAARTFLKEHYPLLADRLEQGTFEFMATTREKTDQGCTFP